ncbi:MAG TPA: DUF3572 domain-containing protein [Roseiarcus sp.]|jgi:hypothetical protein|nr:DUF3572 domain-containing protein [Roseiarcus sp.]
MRDSLRGKQSANPDFAQSVAVKALAFIAADSERLARFLNLTGLGPHNLRTAAADPAFLASVLDYLAADEALLVAFAADAGLKPEAVARAREFLRGPAAGEP